MKVLHLLKTSVGARWALLQLRELMQRLHAATSALRQSSVTTRTPR